MIADVNYGLSLQITCLFVSPSTRKLLLMSTDVNYGLSLQITCLLVNPYTCQLVNLSPNPKGYPAFHAPPYGGGGGGGASWGAVGLLVCFAF